jgi:2-iminobutanoate/2-iminopropanoate deaminase
MSLAGADKKVITPADGVPPVGPYSPGLLTSRYLYVSGQGAAKADGTFPATAESQTAQCLSNVARIVEAAGLTMEHVVAAQVYMKDLAGVDGMNRAWRATFPGDPPARVVLGVARMPVDTPVEITVTATRDLGSKQSAGGSAVVTSDRVYVTSCPTLDAVRTVLRAAGLDRRNLASLTEYRTAATVERAAVNVAAIAGGAATAFTGIAARNFAERRQARQCVSIGDTLFCPPQSGAGDTIEKQVRNAMRGLQDGLEAAGMTFEDVVATNVYLNDIGEFARMNKVYAEHFGKTPPTRTTIQPFPTSDRKVQISLIAVK